MCVYIYNYMYVYSTIIVVYSYYNIRPEVLMCPLSPCWPVVCNPSNDDWLVGRHPVPVELQWCGYVVQDRHAGCQVKLCYGRRYQHISDETKKGDNEVNIIVL